MRVVSIEQEVRAVGHLYTAFIIYLFVTILYSVVLVGVFIVKVFGGAGGIDWPTFGKYFFGVGGLGVATYFFKPVRDKLLRQH
jgi:hypothetical protein